MSIKFVEYDSETVISELVAQFEKVLGETLQPSDERRIFLYQLAQVIIGIKANINDTGNQVLLRYARGENLNAIGELLGVERLPARYAKCSLKFTLSAIQDIDITIPKGTRATPDGKIYFATDEELVILAGSIDGEVTATALTSGNTGNDFPIGQIKYIVDNQTYLASVTNTSVSGGGSTEESDDNYRERIRLVPESFSTAGCSESYIYWAKSASADVGDVVVYSTVNDMTLTEEERMAGAGKVEIYFLKADGTIPKSENNKDNELINIVREAVSAKDRRPLTDMVTVSAPIEKPCDIDLVYYISKDDELNAADIRKKVDDAVAEYISWQRGKIGRDINPDKLRQFILNAGASRVTITSPSDTGVDIKEFEVAVPNLIKADFVGFTE